MREDILAQPFPVRDADVIADGGDLSEAFDRPRLLDDGYKGDVIMGERSGTLEQTFTRIAMQTAEAAETRLAIFNQLYYRLFLPPLMLSIIFTAARLANTIFF